MAVAGHKPKPPGEALGNWKPAFEWTEVENTPNMKGPQLPKKRANGADWLQRTRDKWLAWRKMPHASLWTDSDWDFALDSIEVAARFHGGASQMAPELRQREAILGVTADARRDLRIRYIAPKKPELAVVHQADDFRDL